MFKHKCKDASLWMIRLQDEDLPLNIRLQLKVHLWMCKRCRSFEQQLKTIDLGMQTWKEYSE